MITLRELFRVTWDITVLQIVAREPDSMEFIHEWIYGEDIHESIHMYHDRMEGKLSIIEGRINHHGEPIRGGAETGWGVKEKLFPAEILDAPVTHLSMSSRSRGQGTSCRVDIEMHRITAMKYVIDQVAVEDTE